MRKMRRAISVITQKRHCLKKPTTRATCHMPHGPANGQHDRRFHPVLRIPAAMSLETASCNFGSFCNCLFASAAVDGSCIDFKNMGASYLQKGREPNWKRWFRAIHANYALRTTANWSDLIFFPVGSWATTDPLAKPGGAVPP